jgi:plastocyanin
MANPKTRLHAGIGAIAFAIIFALPILAHADGANVFALRFEQRRFAPQTLTVPAGQSLVLRVTNASNETIEFESFRLNREVAMTPGETVTVRLPALSAGTYDFYDDFHQDVPQGTLIAK